jgi:looped-hinge helix DNA binding domain, AbrB family
MTLKIDKVGRVILPKPVRDRLGLRAGSDLEVQETPEGVLLKPADRRPSLIGKGSFWVHTGELPPGYDIRSALAILEELLSRKHRGHSSAHSLAGC